MLNQKDHNIRLDKEQCPHWDLLLLLLLLLNIIGGNWESLLLAYGVKEVLRSPDKRKLKLVTRKCLHGPGRS